MTRNLPPVGFTIVKSKMTLFRKKPIIIDAWQTGQGYDEDLEIMKWCGGKFPHEEFQDECLFYIETLEGEMNVSSGDWVIQGVNGEFYPCKPDIFEKTYELI